MKNPIYYTNLKGRNGFSRFYMLEARVIGQRMKKRFHNLEVDKIDWITEYGLESYKMKLKDDENYYIVDKNVVRDVIDFTN